MKQLYYITMVRRYLPVNLPEEIIKEIDYHKENSPLFNSRAGLIKHILVNWIQTREKEMFNTVLSKEIA